MYRIILTENNVKIKTLSNYYRKKDAISKFTKLIETKVHFPKKQLYKNKKLIDVFYKIYLMKKREDGDKSIVVRDEYGKIMDDFMNDREWVVIGESEYNIEETFFVSGSNSKLHLGEIINHVLLPKITKETPKQVIILNNKVLIEGLTFNMITCKNINDSIRLYNKIRSYCFDNKLKNIVFFGRIPKENKKYWYKKINELTGVKYNRLYRNTSR